MRISVIGCGYVGLVTATCFAEMGNRVTCVERDRNKLDMLAGGRSPIFEPGLESMLSTNMASHRLGFTADLPSALIGAEIIFIAVGTPSAENGAADISQILSVASEIGQHLDNPAIVVCKSTAPVGTACRVQSILDQCLTRRQAGFRVPVVSNPEFLKEGAALNDFMRPDRVVLGSDDPQAMESLRKLYEPFLRNHDRILVMGRRDAELTKYAANAFLATRISFMNEMASLSVQLGADIEQVRKGIGADTRIGHHFIYAGCGYGGSCFPKDISALLHMADERDEDMRILRAVAWRNDRQKDWLFDQLSARLSNQLPNAIIAIWGLAFKPGTDDIRDASSCTLLRSLLAAGAQVQAFDPVANGNIAGAFPEALASGQLRLLDDPYQAARFADALVLVTEWKQFRQPDFSALKALMRHPLIIDGRNQYPPEVLRAHGFEHVAVGRPVSEPSLRPALREVG